MASVLVVKEEVALELSLFDLADVATVRGGLVVVEEVYRHPAMVSNSRPLPLSVRFRSIVPQPPSRLGQSRRPPTRHPLLNEITTVVDFHHLAGRYRMAQLDLSYPNLLQVFGEHAMKERTESRQFLAWFLENYYRLEETEVSDCICDGPYDKGVDGLYVDDHLVQIDIFQARISKTDKTLGDVALKEFAGTLTQFSEADSVRKVARTTKNKELAALIKEARVAEKIDDGYQVFGVFITNAVRDYNATEFLYSNDTMKLFDADALQCAYVSISRTDPINKPIALIFQGFLMSTIRSTRKVQMVIAPIAASELLRMEGIANGELFAWNVRQWLGKKTRLTET